MGWDSWLTQEALVTPRVPSLEFTSPGFGHTAPSGDVVVSPG